MSDKYRFTNDQNGIYFVTLTVVDWVDLFTRKEIKLLVVESLNYCIREKGLIVYCWCIMPSHVHMIISAKDDFSLSDIMRDFKKFTSKEIIRVINEIGESRREWLLERFYLAGKDIKRVNNYKVWQDGSMAKGIETKAFLDQKLDYIHNNPIEGMIVDKSEEYIFSSARDYAGEKSLVENRIGLGGEINVGTRCKRAPAGATPATSTATNGYTTFNTPGSKMVTLTISNVCGTNSLTKTYNAGAPANPNFALKIMPATNFCGGPVQCYYDLFYPDKPGYTYSWSCTESQYYTSGNQSSTGNAFCGIVNGYSPLEIQPTVYLTVTSPGPSCRISKTVSKVVSNSAYSPYNENINACGNYTSGSVRGIRVQTSTYCPSPYKTTVKAGSNVKFVGQNSVMLNPGFSTETGSVFKAFIAPCNEGNPLKIAAEDEDSTLVENNLFYIYPNPSSGVFNISLRFEENVNAKISLHNIMGVKVRDIMEKDLSEDTFELDLSQYSSGLYFIKLESVKGIVTKRIVLSK